MKRISLLAVLIAGVLACGLFAAEEPNTLDLDGREVVILFYERPGSGPRVQYTRTARVTGKIIKCDFSDVNDLAYMELHGREQPDEVVKLVVGDKSLRKGRYRKGLELTLPTTVSELGGRKVVVRVYKNWRQDPNAYEKAVAKTYGRAAELAADDVDESAVVAVFGCDQQDRLLKELIGCRVYGWGYVKGFEFTLPEHKPAKQAGYHLAFIDALGNSLCNATVGVHLCAGMLGGKIHSRIVEVGRMKTDGRGNLRLPFCLVDAKAGVKIGRRRYGYVGSGRFVFEVSHPDYKGVGVVEPHYSAYKEQSPIAVCVPFVPRGSEADKRSIWGVVVGPDKRPVSGVVVEGRGLIPLGGMGVGRVRQQDCGALTNQNGRFRLYLPTRVDREYIGRFVPPKSEYYVHIKPPADLGFAPFDGSIPNGQETTITLERAGRFRTFVFEDEKGRITNFRRLRTIGIGIERHGQRDLRLGYYGWRDGGMFPLGTYRPLSAASGERNCDFVPIEVTHDSPEQLVFRFPRGDKTYYGQVVNGITGEPMQGAFVIEPGRADNNPSILSEAQWDALHKLPDNVSAGDKSYRDVANQLCNVFDLDSRGRLIRTNKDGRFRLRIPAKVRVGRLAVFEQDYFSVIIESSKLKQNADGNFEIPTVKMFPAAKVKVQFGCEGEKDDDCPRVCPEWIVHENNPAWAKELVAGCRADYRNDVRIHNDFYLSDRFRKSFYAPAGLKLDLQLILRGWRKEEGWSPITIAKNVKLEQCQILDLGRHTIQRAFAIFVDVTNPAGEPVEGVPVTARDQYGRTTRNTDEKGAAVFSLARDSKGEFVVEYKPAEGTDEPHLREAMPYEIKGIADANTVLTLKVSDEILYHLFK